MANLADFDIARWQPPPRPVYPFWKRMVLGAGMLVGRSLFPILTVLIIAGTLLWGPWVTLALASTLFLAAIRWA